MDILNKKHVYLNSNYLNLASKEETEMNIESFLLWETKSKRLSLSEYLLFLVFIDLAFLFILFVWLIGIFGILIAKIIKNYQSLAWLINKISKTNFNLQYNWHNILQNNLRE